MQIAQCLIEKQDQLMKMCEPLIMIDPHLVLGFGPAHQLNDPAFLKNMNLTFPKAAIAGCSTAGQIGNFNQHDGAVVITAVRFDRTAVRVTQAPITSIADSWLCGVQLGTALAGPGLAGVLMFSIGIGVNGSALIDGLVSAIGREIPISGGLAADDGAFKRTFIFSRSGVSDASVVAIGLYGDNVAISNGSFGGWKPFGPVRRITRAEGNVLYEIEGERALDMYRRHLGNYAENLPASGLLFPFEILDSHHAPTGLIRTVLGIDEATGSLILASSINQMECLRLMHSTTDDLIDGAEAAARVCFPAQGVAGQGLALLVSCIGRKILLGQHVSEEISAVGDVLGPTFALAGFYSYGEISTSKVEKCCRLHNQTMTISLIQEP